MTTSTAGAPAQPLRVVREEYGLIGAHQVALGIVFGAIALSMSRTPLAGLAALAIEAAFFGGFMYVVTYRRYFRRAVEDAQALSDAKVQSRREMVRALAPSGLAFTLLIAALTLIGRRGGVIAPAIALGNGVATLTLVRWIRAWEVDRRGQLLREARWRGRENGRWGRGIMDGRDFYHVRDGRAT